MTWLRKWPKHRLLIVTALLTSPWCAAEEQGPLLPEDFCSRTNSAWSAATSIPNNRPWIGEYVESYDRVQARIGAFVLSAAAARVSEETSSIAALYRSAMDLQRRDTLGLSPLRADLKLIDELRTPNDIALIIAKFGRRHRDLTDGSSNPVPAPFALSVWLDDSDTTRYIVQLSQSGLGLPSREYYLDVNPALAALREKYVAQIDKTFAAAGIGDSARAANNVFELEKRIAELQWNSVETQNRSARRKFKISQLSKLTPGFPWSTFARQAGFSPRSDVLLRQPSYVVALAALLVDSPYAQVADYFRWQLLRHYSAYLSEAVSGGTRGFYQETVLGSKATPTLENSAVMLIESYLPQELAAAFVKTYFPLTAKKSVERIGEDVRRALIHRMTLSTWLSSSAKIEAAKKIERLNLQIGYPEPSATGDRVALDPGELIANLINLSERAYQRELTLLDGKGDRSRWWISPLSVNASYSQSANTLIIPAGRLQPPLFDPNAGSAANLGGVGTLIGHEMGHAIDNQGSQYDRLGNIRDWWTPDDHASFRQRTNQLVRQYGEYEPLANERINGAATLSENIADLVGLTVAYDALASHDGSGLSRADEHEFFLAWARRWRVKYSDALLLRVIKSDTHSPNQYRCSGPLHNFPPFFSAYGAEPLQEPVSIW